MTLRHLRVFAAVCEEGSVTRAADRLYLSQPAVSQAIREIEAAYAVKVFDRIGRHIELTDAGRELLTYASALIALYDEMEAHMQDDGGRCTLRIGASITIGTRFMPAYIRRFRERCPQAEIRLTVNSTERLEEQLLVNRLDAAFVEGRTQSPLLTARPYLEDKLTAVCPPEHPFARRTGVDLAAFLAEPLLLREPGSGTRAVFEQAVAARGQCVQPPLWESTSTGALLAGVAQGIGLSVLPVRLVEDAVQRGRVALVAIDGIDLSRRFCLVRHTSKYLSQTARRFMDMVLAEPEEVGPQDH